MKFGKRDAVGFELDNRNQPADKLHNVYHD